MTQSSPAETENATLFTVIIPVFNTDTKLIERAVCSVLNQSYPNFELILVDDGSTVKVAKFLDFTAERDSRIRVIHRRNGGVSAARNTGLDYAAGNFITYLDADDYLLQSFLSSALSVARVTDADAVYGGIRVLRHGGSVAWRTGDASAKEPLLASREELVTACARALADSPSPDRETQLMSVTNVLSCIFKADIAQRHRFVEGVSHAEDRLYNLHVLLNVGRAAFCSDVWYVYDASHEQGATRRATDGTVNALTRTVQEFARVPYNFSNLDGLTSKDQDRIAQAAADGALNYLKMLTGVIAAVGKPRTHRPKLSELLAERSVKAAVARSRQRGWQNQVFATAARLSIVDLLMLFGWLWVRTSRGFHMSTAISTGSNIGRG